MTLAPDSSVVNQERIVGGMGGSDREVLTCLVLSEAGFYLASF